MKPLLLILILAFSVSAQTPNWKLIKEMSGEVPSGEWIGVKIETYAAEIARNGDTVKVLVDLRLPNGVPANICDDGTCMIPRGADPSQVRGATGRIILNCSNSVVRVDKEKSDLYMANGKHYPSKEPPFTLKEGHILFSYFCEESSAKPVIAPKLKP